MVRNYSKKNFKAILFIIAIWLSGMGCSDVSPDAVDLAVDFTWEGMNPCGWGNPEIQIKNLPANTKALKVSMYDSVYLHDHGEVTFTHDGSGIIPMGASEELQGPCPPDVPGRYKITVEALDDDNVVIGVGSKKRYFPENT